MDTTAGKMKITGMAVYDWKKIGRSGKWAFPMILLLGYLGFAYTMAPAGVMSSFSMSAYVLFLLMMGFGLITDTIDNPMIDAAILVKCGKRQEQFYIARMIAVGLYGLIGTVIAMAVPCIRFLISGTHFFVRAFTFGDVLAGVLLHILFGLSGGIFGLLLNNRIIPRRPVAVGAGVLIALVSILKIPMEQSYHWVKFIVWIFPPISELELSYGHMETGAMSVNQIGYVVYLLCYCLLEAVVYVWGMKKLKIR